jgi:hypothetical protein
MRKSSTLNQEMPVANVDEEGSVGRLQLSSQNHLKTVAGGRLSL